MPPKKKVERAATENISLGPQVREGEFAPAEFPKWGGRRVHTNSTRKQVNSSLASPASLPLSTIPLSMSPISGSFTHDSSRP